MDIWSQEKRSQVMARIRSKNTKPELIVRSLIHSMGYRYRLHRKDLPGCPDIVLPKYRAVIFVHGCFWHLHPNCRDGTIPKTQSEKWKAKLEKNVERDKKNLMHLQALGWRTLVLWECDVEKRLDYVREQIIEFLGSR
jgi:DNA mismatch endonuclease (patch repair protein)